MANSPPISARVRQQLEDFSETEERHLLSSIEQTIEQTPLKYLFDDGPWQQQVVKALILHVEVFVEPAQKFKALERRNTDLFLPNLMERLKAGLDARANNAVPRPQRKEDTSGGENQTYTRESSEPPLSNSVRSDPGLSSVHLPKGEEQTQSATARELGGSSDSDSCELPAFAPEALRRIELSILTAGNTLQEELLACWSRYFPLGVSRVRAFEPELFFQPFCSYGAAIYDAFATELIASISDYVKYEKIINNALKTHVCNRLAPFGHEGEWQRFLFASWKLFDHPRHSELHRLAIEVVEAFDGVVPRHWHPFIQSLHKAISRRTLHWLVEWKKLQAEKNAKREQLDAHTTADPEQLLKVFATSEPDTGIVMTPCDGAAIRLAAVESVIRAATPAAGGKNVARPAERSGRLSGRDLQIHDLVGGERFHTLANAEIMKEASVKKRLRVDFQLEPGDAAKSCLDRIRHAKGYPLSREIAEKRSSRK